MAIKPTIILTRLEAERRYLARGRLIRLIPWTLLALGLPLAVAGLLDSWSPLREPTAGFCLGLAAVVTVVALLVGLWRLRRQLPDERALAVAIEQERPAYMDSLVCAVELLKQPLSTLNALNHALLVKVTRRFLEEDLRAVTRRWGPKGWQVALLWLLSVGLVAAGVLSPLSRKGVHHWADVLNGTSTGLSVSPGSVEIAQGDDLIIEATIHRGPNEARIEIRDTRGDITYDMYSTEGAVHSIDLYGVDADFTYRVVTPTLASRFYEVRTFRRPELKSESITVTPPAYTGQPVAKHAQLVDVAAPQDSQIEIALTTNMPVKARLQPLEGDAIEFEASGDTSYQATFPLSRSLEYHIVLDDLHGHEVATPATYLLDAIADTAPSIQVLQPEEDSTHDKIDAVEFALGAFDNYGLSSVQLHVSVNGGAFEATELYRAKEGKLVTEQNVTHSLKLDGKVDYGDVVYYYGVALDNHQPEALEGRTDIRFLEIRPPRPELKKMDDMQGGGGGGGPSLSLDVSDLIVAQKHIIRDTFRISQMPDSAQRTAMLQELAVAAADQHLNASRRYNDIKEKAGGIGLGEIDRLFPPTIKAMQETWRLLESETVEGALPFEQSALSKLVAIEIELQKNAQQQKGQGQGKGQKSQQKSESQFDEENKNEERQDKIAGLKEKVEALKDLIQRQENLNRGLATNQTGDQLDSQFRPQAGNQQKEILKTTYDVRNDLSQTQEAFGVVKELDKAAHQMTSTRQSIQLNHASEASKQGQLAEQFLRRSKEALESLLDDMQGNPAQMAGKMMKQLAERQGKLRQETGQAAGGQAAAPLDELSASQQKLREDFESMMKELTEVAGGLEKQDPQGAKRLDDVLQEARRENVESSMKRAENALRYKRPERSVDYQKEAEASLAKLAKQLEEAGKQSGGPGREQLARMLQKAMQDLEGMQKLAEDNASAEEKRQQAQKMSDNLQEMSSILKDPRMQQLAAMAQSMNLGGEGFSAADVQNIMAITTQTARLLEMKLLEQSLAQRVEFSRMAGREPPEAFRKLVNEYFKKLSENK